MSKELDEAFDIQVIEPDTVDGRPLAVRHSTENVDQNVDDDYAKTRENLHAILENGVSAVEKAFRVAIESESPKAFESASILAKALADINEQLLTLSEKRVKLKKATQIEGEGGGPSVTNNTFFVGTTAELHRSRVEAAEAAKSEKE